MAESFTFKSKQSNRPKNWWGIGCGIGCLVLALCMLGVVGLGFYIFKTGFMREVHRFEEQGFVLYEGEVGFRRLVGRELTLTEPLPEMTLVVGQAVTIEGGSAGDMVIIARKADIYNTIEGTLYFRGQELVVHPDAVIEKDLDIKGFRVQIEGEIKGEIVGKPKELIDQRVKTKTLPEGKDEDKEEALPEKAGDVVKGQEEEAKEGGRVDEKGDVKKAEEGEVKAKANAAAKAGIH